MEDDWGTVLHLLMVDRVREEERKRRRKENSETEKKEIQRKVVLSHLYKPADLLRCGQHGGPRCHRRPQVEVCWLLRWTKSLKKGQQKGHKKG
jgi:hypothetical protein